MTHPGALWLAVILVAIGADAAAQNPSRIAAIHQEQLALAAQHGGDSVRLHRLFALNWEYGNLESPETATAVGYPGQNDRWTDNSLAAIDRRKRELRDPLGVLRSIDRATLGAADQFNYDLFRGAAELAIEGTRFPAEDFAITQLGGPQYLAATLEQNPTATVKDYEDIVARLGAVPAVIDQAIALLDRGLAAGVTPPRVTLRDVPEQVQALAGLNPMASPLLVPFTHFPPAIVPAERARLTAAATRAFTDRVRPAYAKLSAYLTSTYLPRARASVGMKELPDGAAWYAYNARRETTTSLTPERIHAIGLSEVRRIRAEMDSVIASTGFKGSFADFTRFLRTDRRFFLTDSAALVRAYRDIAKRVDPELVGLFGTLPRLTYGVTAIPSYQAKSQTTAYYQPGSPEAGRPGYYYVNTYALDTRPTWEMEALTLHESVPGHHLQIAIAQELSGLPEFRRNAGYTAFVEGWALYSESLGGAMGLYRDPYSRFGQLTYEVWRAIRLVVDTGIHSMGWSRQQAIDYFVANSAKSEHDITVEVDRYIVWPGQALAYKIGELKIRELRAYAERELGARFDIRRFHDEVLGRGALPLDVLDARIRAWVVAQRARE